MLGQRKAIAGRVASRNDRSEIYRVGLTYGHQTAKKTPVAPALVRRAQVHLLYTFARMYGGAQVSCRSGSYQLSDGSIFIEQSTTEFAYAQQLQFRSLVQAARSVSHLLDQETVLIVVERVPGVLLHIGHQTVVPSIGARSGLDNGRS